jgi:hypothetical protein
MPLWHLLPLDRTSDHWRASTYKGEVIVRAASEAEARSTAAADFSRAYARTPGGPMFFSPWGQPSIVGCQRVEGVPQENQGPAAVVYPFPEDEGAL